MRDAENAYALAERRIAIAKRSGTRSLDLNTSITRALTHLPPAISGLTKVTWLDLSKTQITDAGLAQISDMTGLKTLDLTNTRITDAGLTQIRNLTGLQTLYLAHTQITDAGLAQISGLAGLQMLDLDNTQITDLRLLRGFTQLLEAPDRSGLSFANCAAAKAEARIAEIAEIEDNQARTQALFDLIDDGWVPPVDGIGQTDEKATAESLVPRRRPAPMEVLVTETSIDLVQDGRLPKADANSRAAMGWEALKALREEFATSFNIGNYAPLPAYLAAFDRAMADQYDASRVILIGLQARRFVALSMDDTFLKNLPDGAAADLKNFAAETLVYLNRFPDWLAYREDADEISPEGVRGQTEVFNAIRQVIDATPEASEAVKAEYAAEVVQGTAPSASAEEATGVIATTGEIARSLAESQKTEKALQKRNREMAKRGGEFWDRNVLGPLSFPITITLRLERPLRKLSASHPGRLGWIAEWYDLKFGKPEDRD